MSYLLDADAIWELAGLQPDVGLADWLVGQPEERLYMSAATLGELAARAQELADPGQRERLHAWLGHDLLERFGRRLLPIDAAVALQWGLLRGRLPPADAWLAAVARAHDLTVVTQHGGALERAGIRVLDPWLG